MLGRDPARIYVVTSVPAALLAACTITTDLTGLSSSSGRSGTTSGVVDGGSSGVDGGSSGASGGEGGVDAGPPAACVDKSVTKRGGTATSTGGGFGAMWTPANGALVADDGAVAEVQISTFFAPGALVVKKFGFAVSAGAYVKGVKVSVKKRGDASVRDGTVRLVVSGDSAGEDKKKSTPWRDGFEVTEYGDAGDRWGLGLTPAIVSSEAFGVAFNAAYDDAGNGFAAVDEIAMTVTYCE